jgi:hypothetical protein
VRQHIFNLVYSAAVFRLSRSGNLIGAVPDFRALIEAMAQRDTTSRLSWPWWSPWALLGVVITSLLTIAATLNDIL